MEATAVEVALAFGDDVADLEDTLVRLKFRSGWRGITDLYETEHSSTKWRDNGKLLRFLL
jgi:hypothetical protein